MTSEVGNSRHIIRVQLLAGILKNQDVNFHSLTNIVESGGKNERGGQIRPPRKTKRHHAEMFWLLAGLGG